MVVEPVSQDRLGFWSYQVMQEARRALRLINEREVHPTAGSSSEPPVGDDFHDEPQPSMDAQAHEDGDQKPVDDELIAQAVKESEVAADRQEDALMQEALLFSLVTSKMDRQAAGADAAPNEVVLIRLTTFSDDVRNALFTPPGLAPCREAVRAAGCELVPAWGRGLTQFVPLGSSPFHEHELSDLCHHHVIIRRFDIPELQSTLRTLKSKRRPTYKQVRAVDVSNVDVASNATIGDASELAAEDLEVVRILGAMVVNTFVHCPVSKTVSEASVCVQSAPSGSRQEPVNPRRWAAKRASGTG
jgi:hypothetical protein